MTRYTMTRAWRLQFAAFCFFRRSFAVALSSALPWKPLARVSSTMVAGRAAVSVAFSTTGDVLQQPSVEVALTLAATVFDPSSAVGSDSARTADARVTLPALRRTLGYL